MWLYFSLIWGSVGVAYCVYGKKAQSLRPFVGGILMLLASYLIGSSLVMSLVCVGIMAAVYYLSKWGY